MNKRFVQLGVTLVVLTLVLSACGKGGENPDEAPFVLLKKQYYNEPSYCTVTAECELYDCSKCSNIYYLDKVYEGTRTCDKENNSITGCECVDNKCLRSRK